MIYQKDLTLRAVFLKFHCLIYDIGFCFRGHFYPFSRTTCSDSDFSWKQLTARTGNHVEWVGSVAIEHWKVFEIVSSLAHQNDVDTNDQVES